MHDKRQVSTCVGSLVTEGVVVSEIRECKGCSGNKDSTESKDTMLILECYSCKQLLKDSYLTFTLTLKVNIHSVVYGFKDKSRRTDMVNQTAESTGKSSNFHVFGS